MKLKQVSLEQNVGMKSNGKKPIVSIRHLIKDYGKAPYETKVLKDINIDLDAGEFVILWGESGSGKTTLMNMIAGFENPTSGNVIVNSTNITQLTESQKAAFRCINIGFIFQQYQLIDELNALENVMMPLLIGHMTISKAKERAEAALEHVGLADRLNHHSSELSGGQKQRVAIARALVLSPKIILADEPTGNLDSRNREDVLELLRQANQKYHQTILMVTHSQSELSYANRIIKIKDGIIL